MKLGFVLLVFAMPCSAQTADMFIKSDPVQCWLDTKDVVHRHAINAIDDETTHSMKVERYSSMQGDLSILVHVSSDIDKKKGEGCRLYVSVVGDASMSVRADAINSFRGSSNTRVVHQIADEVMAMQKKREKKAKKP
jgi:hypothetical protein